MIQELIELTTLSMTANGDSFSFLHSEKDWQNYKADEVTLPAVYLDMPVRFTPVITASGFIENQFKCTVLFLYKSELDDSPAQKYATLSKCMEACRQFLILLSNNSDDVKKLTPEECYQVLNLFDANLDGVALPFGITLHNVNSVCVGSSPKLGSSYEIKDEDGNVLYSGFLTLGTDLIQSIDNSVLSVKDSSGTVLKTISLLAESIGETTINDSQITNSDNTFSQSVKAESPLILPDVTHIDSDGSTVSFPSAKPFTCTYSVCGDANQIITDSQGNELYNNSIPSGATETQSIQDSVITLKDTSANVLSTNNILAESSQEIISPDAVINFQYEDGTPIATINYLSGSNQDFPLKDCVVENSNATYTANVLYENNLVLPDITVTEYDGEIRTQPSATNVICKTIPLSGWVRPSEWLPLPTFTPSDNRIVILCAIYEGSHNYYVFSGVGLHSTIFWGDGSSDVSNGGYQSKLYDYITLAGAVNVDEFGRNYKQVIIDIINTSSQTLIRLGRIATQPTGFLDLKAQSTTLTVFDFLYNQFAPYLKKVDISGLTQNAVHNSLFQLKNARNIAEITFNPALTGAITSYWFNLNYGLKYLASFTTNTNTLASAFGSSHIQKVGDISAPFALGNNMFDACKELSIVGNINMPSCTNAIQFFRNCYNLTKVGNITFSNSCISISEMFLACNVEEVVFLSSLANVTAVANFLGGATNVKRLVTPNLTRGISIINAQMSATALNEFFTSLGTASGAQTITVTGNVGASTCNTSIATAKGFTVVI